MYTLILNLNHLDGAFALLCCNFKFASFGRSLFLSVNTQRTVLATFIGKINGKLFNEKDCNLYAFGSFNALLSEWQK